MITDMTYELLSSGPAPMSWDEYTPIVRREWQELLDREGTGEPDFHEFLERHPCMIPGHDAFTGARGWDNPAGSINGCVVSKPLVPGISNRYPDFMWAPTDSQTQWIVLIEIEDPKKPWFTGSGQRSEKLTQAEDQIAQWRAHLKNPANLLLFMELYEIPRLRPIEFAFCLVYGRRKEVSHPTLAEKRNSLRSAQDDVTWMTYDRLRPDEDARNYPSVKVNTAKELTAIHFPPTTEIDLWCIEHWRNIKGKREAVFASPHFTQQRRDFLVERLDYWDQFLASGGHISPADYTKGE